MMTHKDTSSATDAAFGGKLVPAQRSAYESDAYGNGDNPFFPLSQGRKSLGRCLMSLALIETVVIAAIVTVAFATAASAFEGGKTVRQIEAPITMAYADPDPARDGVRHEDIFLDAIEFDDEHPMNDAWMGMNVITIDGVLAGYVSDAFMGETGNVETVVIHPSADSGLDASVEVPSRFLMLGDETVTIDMTLATLRAQPVFSDLALAE